MEEKNGIINFLETKNKTIDEKNPFDHIDALIFSAFAYLPYGDDIRNYNEVKIYPKNMTMGEFAKALLDEKNEEILKKRFGSYEKIYKEYYSFCEALKDNKRYKNLKIIELSHCNSKDFQFASYSIKIDENIICICYRGTDGTYDGWNENFNMLDEIARAQIESLVYLQREMLKNPSSKFYITGHSKGGNLAIYGAVRACKDLDYKIEKVYNFDGPGFNEEFLKNNKESISCIKDKLYCFMIENTVVGELLYGQEEIYKKDNLFFIKTNPDLNILKEHDIFSFIIKDNDFVYTSQSNLSKKIDKYIDNMSTTISRTTLEDIIYIVLNSIKILREV